MEILKVSLLCCSVSKLNSDTEQHKSETFNISIKEKLGYAMKKPGKPPPSYFISYSYGDLYPPALHELDKYPVQSDVTAVFEQPITYHWIHAELNLPQGGGNAKS